MQENQDSNFRKTRGHVQRAAVAGSDSIIDFRQVTATDPVFRNEIQRETLHSPRFLFCAWSEDQDDCRTINTRDSITPAMFKDSGLAKRHIYDIPKVQLIASAKSHQSNQPDAKSYFSSWTHSWKYLSPQFQRMMCSGGIFADVYISIIDTKLLQKQNVVVLHSSFFNRLDANVPAIDEVYLAYGVISGRAYKAVSFYEIAKSNALSNISPLGTWPHYRNLNEAIEGAKLFGNCFGVHFSLPVAVTLLSFPDDMIRSAWTTPHSPSFKRVLDALIAYDVSKDWIEDFKSGLEKPHSTPDVARANFVLATIIEKKYGQDVFRSSSIDRMVIEVSEMAIEPTSANILNTKFPNDTDTFSYCPSTVSQQETILATDNDGFIRDEMLPHGKMDANTKRNVLASQRKTPRFLFRGWCNSEHHASGGHSELNKPNAITPYAFHVNHLSEKQTIYDLSFDELRYQAVKHLKTRPFPTQFSSWASSLKVALCFCKRRHEQMCNQCHISIVDTERIDKQKVFLYVPSLTWLDMSCTKYTWEYLAHGVIQGKGLKSIPMRTVVNGGIPESCYSGLSPKVVASPERHIECYPTITEQELRSALRVAELYGGDFVVPVGIAILCQKTRDSDLWRSGNIPGLSMVAAALKKYPIPLDWCRTFSLLEDVVDSGGYGDVDQMIMLLRALLHHQRGKGARTRNRLFGTVLSEIGDLPE